MTTKEFLNLLKTQSNKSLLFQYTPGQLVGANYHITEVKHVTVDAVDCGAGVDNWNETIIQLWESPNEIGKTAYMSAYKALGILNKVGKMKPYDLDATIKIEYGNRLFHTTQLYINNYEIQDANLLFTLAVEQTDCKAKETCGIPVSETLQEQGCAPGSGCC